MIEFRLHRAHAFDVDGDFAFELVDLLGAVVKVAASEPIVSSAVV